MQQPKQHATKIQGRELVHYRGGHEEHGFVLAEEAILKGGNPYTGEKKNIRIARIIK